MSAAGGVAAKWHIDGLFDADVNVDIRDENDFAICEIGPFEEDWTPEEIQRAHLIAAAPELLAAAKQKLAHCKKHGDCSDAALLEGEYCSDECSALASAIDKAVL